MTDTFQQAAHYTPASRKKGDITLIGIHAMQAPEKGTTAESCAAMFARGDRRASAHWCHDSDSSVRSVKDKDVAWAAPNANRIGIHHELAGYSEQTPGEWRDPFSDAMLHIAAKHVADDCRTYEIPRVWLSVADLKAGKRWGITSHNNISLGLGGGTHWDPGPNFPVEYFMSLVNAYYGGIGAKPVPEPLVWRVGGNYDQAAIKFYQGILNFWLALALKNTKEYGPIPGDHKPIPVTGKYDPKTSARTKEYERWRDGRMGSKPGKLQIDGVVTANNLKYIGDDVAWMRATA